MANIRLKDLTSVENIADTDVIVIDGDAGTRVTTWAKMKELIKAQCGINELNTKIDWKNIPLPSPTVSGNKRTYLFTESFLGKELAITINAQGYAVIDSRITLLRSECRYCISYDDGTYQWSADVRILKNSIIVSGISSNASLDSYPVVLSELSMR